MISLVPLIALVMTYLFAMGCCCGADQIELGDDCGNCDTDTTPQKVQVTFSGVQNGNDCTSCGSFNSSTYVLDQDTPGRTSTNDCQYAYGGSLPCSSGGTGTVPDICEIEVWISSGGASNGVIWTVLVLKYTGFDVCEAEDGTGDYLTPLGDTDCDNDSATGQSMSHTILSNCDWNSATFDIGPV